MSQAGNFFEDFAPGQVIRHALGRTVTDADNIWFTGITHNPQDGTFVIEFERNIMVYKRAHAPQGDLVPAPNIAGR